MKTVGIAGGSGFVGRHLAALLENKGFQVIIFSRGDTKKSEKNIRFARWNPARKEIDTSALAEVNIMINLAGAGVADHRWTDDYKKEIISSRVDATHFLLEVLRSHAPSCTTYIATSATGYYGPDRPGSIPFTETDPPYPDFLGEVCKLWEEATQQAASTYRTTIFRLGIVLGKDGGAYPKLTGSMSFGVKPILGSGNQMVSWVHVTDLARMMLSAIEHEQISGTYNAVSPKPVSHKSLMHAFAKAKGGISIPVPVPAFMLNVMMGESSIEVLKSCTASAAKISGSGFQFNYANIDQAANDLAR